jgi:hypothetical protein
MEIWMEGSAETCVHCNQDQNIRKPRVSGLSLLGQGSKKVPKVSCEAVFWKWQDFSIDSVT